jgi:hypothetical protein
MRCVLGFCLKWVDERGPLFRYYVDERDVPSSTNGIIWVYDNNIYA